jgi:hypothetical protein
MRHPRFAGTPAPGGGTFGTPYLAVRSWAETGSNTNKEHLYTFRVDHSITDKQKIYARVKHDDGFQPTTTDLINTTFNEQSVQPEWDGAINYTYVITPTMVNSFIGSALWYSAYFGPANVSASQQLFPTILFWRRRRQRRRLLSRGLRVEQLSRRAATWGRPN